MNKQKSTVKFLGLLSISFYLCSCDQSVTHIGYTPENIESIKGQNIYDIKSNYVIADDLHDNSKYYITSMIYKTKAINQSIEIMENNIYSISTDNKNIITQVKKIELDKTKLINIKPITLPASPDKKSILSLLFTNVGSVSVM